MHTCLKSGTVERAPWLNRLRNFRFGKTRLHSKKLVII